MDKQTAFNIAKAIGYAENGGKPNIKKPKAGKTGEMASIFQYTPNTWKAYSKQILGKEVPMTPDAETEVTQGKVQQWLDKGMTPEQIFSSWNAGTGEPDAYTGKFSDGSPSKGINKKYGVQYDVPGYVNKAMKYYKEFSGGFQGDISEGGSVKNLTLPQLAQQQAQKKQIASNTPNSVKKPASSAESLIMSMMPQRNSNPTA